MKAAGITDCLALVANQRQTGATTPCGGLEVTAKANAADEEVSCEYVRCSLEGLVQQAWHMHHSAFAQPLCVPINPDKRATYH